jgi:hypothetical protein
VKVVRDEWVLSDAALQRFRREACAVAGFAHPNVVTVHGYGVEAGARSATKPRGRRGSVRCGPSTSCGECAVRRAPRTVTSSSTATWSPRDIVLAAGGDGGTVKALDFGVATLLFPRDDRGGIGRRLRDGTRDAGRDGGLRFARAAARRTARRPPSVAELLQDFERALAP